MDEKLGHQKNVLKHINSTNTSENLTFSEVLTLQKTSYTNNLPVEGLFSAGVFVFIVYDQTFPTSVGSFEHVERLLHCRAFLLRAPQKGVT